MPDFSNYQIIWSGHALDRIERRRKPPNEVEREIRTSQLQEDRGRGRWEIVGCVGGYWSRIFVQVVGPRHLVVVTVYDEGKRCN